MNARLATIAGSLTFGLAAAVTFVVPAHAAETLNLTFFAGNGEAGDPEPGPARQASFNGPSDVDVDATGNTYMTAAQSNRVVKITPSGTLSIAAGSGTPGDPVPGSAAASPLRGPSAISVSDDGSFLVSSVGRVARVDTDGQLTVIAGGGTTPAAEGVSATEADLLYVVGVARAEDGSVYVATRSAIYAIDESGDLQLVAGGEDTGEAPEDGALATQTGVRPSGIDVDADENLYIADNANQYVLRIDADTNVLTHVAGTGSTTGTPVAGPATSSPVPYPYNVRVSDDGSLLVTNVFRVLRIDDGQLSILAGNGTGSSPQGGPALASGMRVGGVAESGGSIYMTSNEQRLLRLSSDPAPARPAVTFQAPERVVQGEPLELAWSGVSDADTLVAGNSAFNSAWRGRKDVGGGSQTISDLEPGEHTFTLRADGEGGYSTQSKTVTVELPAAELTVQSSAPIVVSGRPFDASGSGLTFFEDYTVKLSGATVGSGQSEFDGTFSTSVKSPSRWRTAQRPLTVIGSQGNRIGRTMVWTVSPTPVPLSVLKSSTPRGSSQKMTVTSLAPGEPVRIYYDGKKIATVDADDTGKVVHYFKVGSSTGTKRATVLGLVGERRGTKTFKVTR